MYAKELSDGIAALIPYWLHVAVHVALIAWYFVVKSRIGRAEPSTIARMCVPGIWASFAHAFVMALNGSLTWTQGIIGIAVNVGLMVLFGGRYAEARGETQR